METIKDVHGFTCFCVDRGIYSFKSCTPKGYVLIECEKEQLSNGDIEFMILHGLTISKSRKRAYQKRFITVSPAKV